jgi:hypothetical protein
VLSFCQLRVTPRGSATMLQKEMHLAAAHTAIRPPFPLSPKQKTPSYNMIAIIAPICARDYVIGHEHFSALGKIQVIYKTSQCESSPYITEKKQQCCHSQRSQRD